MKENFFPGTCVSPDGRFLVGIHDPSFRVELLRKNDFIDTLGILEDGTPVSNSVNFPHNSVEELSADLVYEIPNPFPFRGTTYINSAWADRSAGRPETISLPPPPAVSMREVLKQWENRSDGASSKKWPPDSFEKSALRRSSDLSESYEDFISLLPRPMLLALAECSTDSHELVTMAKRCCTFQYQGTHLCGLQFKRNRTGNAVPDISDHDLFDIIANNRHLPDEYKRVMVLKPGIQGNSEITGEWQVHASEMESGTRKSLSSTNGDDACCHNGERSTVEGDQTGKSHIFEYLRRNSYIPWGHFAANTADDTVRYKVNDLSLQDMTGMRQLYYQRTYLRLWNALHGKEGHDGDRLSHLLNHGLSVHGIEEGGENLEKRGHCPTGKRHKNGTKKNDQIHLVPPLKREGGGLALDTLERLRCNILACLGDAACPSLRFNGGLWGWNFGFGYAQSGYRLHASHQQIHQQYAMVPAEVDLVPFQSGRGGENRGAVDGNLEGLDLVNASDKEKMSSYACGDMVARFIRDYRSSTGHGFFECYLRAIRNNQRMDGNNSLPASLIVHEDAQVMLFVPKAQTSQWELQLMAIKNCGNILEADVDMRASLDRGILMALQILEKMGARMVTSIEFAKRFDSTDRDQHLIYSFLPKLPHSPGAFSEAQLRWINGHYPEDFASACRAQLCHLSIK